MCSRPGFVSCVVELRGAATDLLHPVVREGLATLRGQAALGERAGKRARRVTDRTNEPRIPTSPHLPLPSGTPAGGPAGAGLQGERSPKRGFLRASPAAPPPGPAS